MKEKLRMDRVRAVATLVNLWPSDDLTSALLRDRKMTVIVHDQDRVIQPVEGCTTDAEVRAGLALALKRNGKR